MPSIIKAKPMVGDDLEDCVLEAIRLAINTGVSVRFTFNDVLCHVDRFTHPDVLIERFHKALDSDYDHKVATG